MGRVDLPDTELREDGASVTIGPRDKYLTLVDLLTEFADANAPSRNEELRRLAWFLGVKGEKKACEAIMKHAGVRERYHYIPY